MSRAMLLGGLVAVGFAVPPRHPAQMQGARPSRLEGSFEYIAPLTGQAIFANGRFVFLYGPVDGSGPMTSSAGTYEIARDTGSATIAYSTDPQLVGSSFRWTAGSWSGDTLAYIAMNDAGQVIEQGRAVKRR
jgi:hypothetical protein